jgi:ketosteroid isomerase-like protein
MPTNKDIVESAYASFAAGDVPAVLGAMDPKIEWNEPEGYPIYGGTVIGPDAVLHEVFMRLGEIGDDFSVIPSQFIAEGDSVVVLGALAWKHKTSGEPAEVKTAHVWTIADGKLAGFRQHVDTVKVRELIA